MAGKEKAAASFDDIIQADRRRRKNETLANNILGQRRRASAPGAGVGNRQKPSLASRVGVSKQSSTAALPKTKANINNQWSHDLHRLNNPQASRVSALPVRSNSARVTRDNRLFAALTSEASLNGSSDQLNVRGSSGMTIRGAAGPFTVLATNFAPGTTADDIEAAIAPITDEFQSCRLISAHPTVIAEIVFPVKAEAEKIIATFNNQKADGRLLHVYMKNGVPATPNPISRRANEPRARSDIRIQDYPMRLQGDKERRRADVELGDGRYGFGGGGSYPRGDNDRGLYSDGILTQEKGVR
ncbi:MAG: hypothetical protein M1837_003634 [Sclerophora amabilis]|nr:MAG: hypothetical protein M1837_003634 [Sclerophora amabilis]